MTLLKSVLIIAVAAAVFILASLPAAACDTATSVPVVAGNYTYIPQTYAAPIVRYGVYRAPAVYGVPVYRHRSYRRAIHGWNRASRLNAWETVRFAYPWYSFQ